MTDTVFDIDQDEADAQKLAEGLRHLRELRVAHQEAAAALEAHREEGRRRVAALQAEIDAEGTVLVAAVRTAAVEFNSAASELVDTGFATPRALAAKGLATIRVAK